VGGPGKALAQWMPIAVAGGLFVACNLIDMLWGDWVPTELLVPLAVFALGAGRIFASTSREFVEEMVPEVQYFGTFGAN
jgi:hypothetical protein